MLCAPGAMGMLTPGAAALPPGSFPPGGLSAAINIPGAGTAGTGAGGGPGAGGGQGPQPVVGSAGSAFQRPSPRTSALMDVVAVAHAAAAAGVPGGSAGGAAGAAGAQEGSLAGGAAGAGAGAGGAVAAEGACGGIALGQGKLDALMEELMRPGNAVLSAITGVQQQQLMASAVEGMGVSGTWAPSPAGAGKAGGVPGEEGVQAGQGVGSDPAGGSSGSGVAAGNAGSFNNKGGGGGGGGQQASVSSADLNALPSTSSENNQGGESVMDAMDVDESSKAKSSKRTRAELYAVNAGAGQGQQQGQHPHAHGGGGGTGGPAAQGVSGVGSPGMGHPAAAGDSAQVQQALLVAGGVAEGLPVGPALVATSGAWALVGASPAAAAAAAMHAASPVWGGCWPPGGAAGWLHYTRTINGMKNGQEVEASLTGEACSLPAHPPRACCAWHGLLHSLASSRTNTGHQHQTLTLWPAQSVTCQLDNLHPRAASSCLLHPCRLRVRHCHCRPLQRPGQPILSLHASRRSRQWVGPAASRHRAPGGSEPAPHDPQPAG